MLVVPNAQHEPQYLQMLQHVINTDFLQHYSKESAFPSQQCRSEWLTEEYVDFGAL